MSPDAPVPREATPRQKSLCGPVVTRTLEQLTTALAGDPHGQAWRLSGAYRGSGAWFTPGPRAAAHILSPAAFRSALSLRLLLPATWSPPGAYADCPHCRSLERGDRTRDHRFHGLNCRLGAGARTTRHDACRDALVQALRRLFGSSAVLCEPRLGPGLKEPDLSLATAAGVLHIDVSVVNPAADRHVAAHSDTTPTAAAVLGEHGKRTQYQHTLRSLGLRDDVFVPFVVEATGRLGPSALAFLDHVTTLPGVRGHVDVAQTLKFLVGAITASVHRGNSLSMARSREQSQVLMTIS